jgi:metal-responsive CopG/Arc/MetJ family transcriptional regulator
MAQKKKPTTAKRLDGKKKLISLTSQMEADIRLYCRERGVESESELIRQAIVKYLDSDYDDNSLKLSGLKTITEGISRLQDTMAIMFKYCYLMHMNLLAYHPEIAEEYKDAAVSSASTRHSMFFEYFREHLADDPPFFEKLLHRYVTGEADGKA